MANRKKTGGRKAGTPNKITSNLRGFIEVFLANNLEEVCDEFSKLEPKEKINAYLKLLKFAIPKLTRMQSEITGKDGGATETIIRFIDDSKDEFGLSE